MNFKEYEKSLNNVTFRENYNKLKLLAKSVFKWNNLPNGMNEKWIENFLFNEGKCVFFKDDIRGFMVAGVSENGMLNPYDEATLIRPVLTNYENDKLLENHVDCVVIRNNDDEIPTRESIKLYAYRLTDISRTIDINISAMKTPVLIAGNKKQMLSLKQIYKQWNGFEPIIWGANELDLSSLQVLKTDAPIVFDKLQIEKHHIWNECMTFLGINNANMDKRERLVDDEVQANNEQVEIFAQMMLKSREFACSEINKMFGTNISVEYRNKPESVNLKNQRVVKNNGKIYY